MSTELILSKIDLLQEQIDNLERSGFFTEAEMDRATVSLRCEKEMYEKHLELNTKQLYGMTPEDYAEGMRIHNECFDQIKNIDVKEEKILTVQSVKL